MKCTACGRETTPVFLFLACDWCDMRDYSPFQGWALVKEIGEQEYVFKTCADAMRWKEASGRAENPVLVSLSKPPRWQLSRGTLRDVVLADRVYTVRPDHRHPFEKDEATCWVAPV